MDRNKLDQWVINISNTSYKFTKTTILKADKAIGHIKKNPKLYKFLVSFIALCLMPKVVDVGKDFVFELIMALANAPIEVLTESILLIAIYIAKAICMIGVIYNLSKVIFNNAVEYLKNRGI